MHIFIAHNFSLINWLDIKNKKKLPNLVLLLKIKNR